MAKAEPKPSTARAATRDQAASGTGQHPRTFTGNGIAPGGVAKLGRLDDSPSKASGKAPERAQESMRSTVPPADGITLTIHKDSGPKTSREREFAAWNASARDRLAGAQERDLYPSPLERGTQAEIAKGDKYAGTANKVSKPKNQAQ